jgi:hypothetical protein
MLNLVPLEVFVNRIIKEGNAVHGYTVFDNTVFENLRIIYSGKLLEGITYLIKNSKDSFYTFDRFCQYIIYLQFQPALGLTLKFSDYKNDTDAALEEYKLLRDNNWRKEDTDKIMKIFQEILEDKNNTARLVIKKPI